MPSMVIRPGVELVEPRHQRADRRLARRRWPDERHRLAGMDGEVDIVQHLLVRLVAEGDALVADVAAQMPDVDGVRRVRDVGRGLQQLEVALESGDAFRIGLQHGVDLLDRPEETLTSSRKPMKPPTVSSSCRTK